MASSSRHLRRVASAALTALATACTSDAGSPPAEDLTATSSPALTASPRATSTTVADAAPEELFVGGTEGWARALRSTSVDTAGPLVAAAPNGDVVVGINIFMDFSADTAPVDLGGERFVARGESDFVIGRFDAAGQHLWSRHIGGPGNELLRALELGRDGSIWLGGGFETALDVGTGAVDSNEGCGFVARLNGTGDDFAIRSMGASVAAIAPLAGGGAVVAGGFVEGTRFGGFGVESAGDLDVFTARLDEALAAA